LYAAVEPGREDDKSEQWMGVSVVSQATDNGKALVRMSDIRIVGLVGRSQSLICF